MNRVLSTAAFALAAVSVAAALSGCGKSAEYPRRPITLVCPWAAGGGTDRVSRQMAVHLEKELGVPVNVVNATGGKGVTGHRRGLKSRPDGYTLMMATIELNMMHWSGLTQLTWEDSVPLMSINEDYAALLVREDASWRDVAELEQAIRENPGSLKASGTASGGIWHLALAGWLQEKGFQVEDVVWISSQGAGPSLQELISGGLDMVCCSLPEASALLASGKVRALGVMAPKRAAGFPDVPTFSEQGTNWSLGGWRGLALPLGTPTDRVGTLSKAIERVVSGETEIVQVSSEGESQMQTFPEFMEQQGFDNTWRPRAKFASFLEEQDAKFGRLLSSDAMQSVGRDPFPAWAFPTATAGLAGLLIVVLLARNVVSRRAPESEPSAEVAGAEAPATGAPPNRGILNFVAVIVAMFVYVMAAETLGFVPTVSLLLFALLWLFGTRWWVSLLIALVFTSIVYELFANLLRVPLPRGLFGW